MLAKPKKITKTKAKERAWKAFSLYIRTRDKDKGCVTCGRVYPIAQMQAGHFIPGRHPSILFDETNVHSQCYGCNVMKKGNMVKYFRFMELSYGTDHIKRLEELDTQLIKRTPQDYLDLEILYQAKLQLNK